MSEQKLFAGERLAGRPWIWFDLDDTLWNFHDNSLVALREIYREYELDRFWPTEQQWLDDYHERVYQELSPLLDDDDRQWLRQATQKLSES